MKTILIGILWQLVKSLAGAGLGDFVLRLVGEAAQIPHMSGMERHEWVRQRLAELGQIGMLAFADVSESLINLTIEAAVQRVRVNGPQ